MKISDLSIKRPVTTIMMVFLVILLGLISLGRINLDLFPNLNFPVAAVITEYQGVGPHEIETMVTRPIENALATVTNIKSISSISRAGQSLVIVEFNWGVDMDFAALEMREKVDMIKRFLPDDVENPLIVKFDPSMFPILQIGISGEEDLVSLKKTVEDKIVPRLERLEGVASVELTGGLNREILIEIDQTKLNNYGISLATVTQTLMMENMNLSGGQIVWGQRELLVRTTGKFKSIDEIKKILLPTSTGFVALEDIAHIKDTYKEVQNLARLDGKPSIGLTIQKQTDANTVKVSNLVKEELKKIKAELGDKLEIAFLMDQSDFIKRSIGNVRTNAIVGGVLAVLVLLLFLRNIRSTIIIATAIPVSVITTFSLIYFGGLTLNMMTLGGLALGIGMLVDNAIVVLENIYRLRQEGLGRIEAASLGSREVGMAIVASTLTTAIVFLPVIFVKGIASELFKELALTITFSLLASLVVALTLIPMLSAKILKVSKRVASSYENGKVYSGWIQEKYRKSLDWCLSHRLSVIILLIVLLLGSLALFPKIGAEFMPEMDEGEFTITARLPRGTVLEQTNQVVEEIEEQVMRIPEVETIFTNVGSAGQIISESSPEVGKVMVRLKNLKARKRSTAEIIEELRQNLRIPDTEISIEARSAYVGGENEAPISIKVKGNDLKVLEDLAVKISQEIAQIPGVREVKDSISKGRPELQIEIDRVKAAKFGLRVTQIASAIKTAIRGDIATRYEVDGQEYDVRVRLKEENRKSLSHIKNLLIPSPLGAKVPLSRIATFEISQGPKVINRENQVRYVEITADIYNADLRSVMKEIQRRLKENIQLPDQYEIEYSGQFEEMVESFKSLVFALLLAIVLVYMVMASQFESLLHPFIIMFTVPMAVIGVILGLFITGHRFSVPSIIGLIMLAGIVVNNAIVLVDYINNLRRKGLELREAILKAGPIRLRPILMTALTTILGLLPLALGIGEGAEAQAPMAVVVIGGLSCATFLTLYVVPVLYSLFEEMGNKVRRLFKKQYESTKVMS
ncbi:multidrug ABC transporter [Anoxybacter fermentans]|uniref:Multidrug ABC transporter n=1 Tax=Anoxybacter fermentans TaxID=1323375 RepID=A0A3S9SWT3_9FIRM|nr:efflux RND transporter permease subunit [Anoxybacter fermentans]AZR72700.1 multidrug ABC transporter [Anoxybacter fermentans]